MKAVRITRKTRRSGSLVTADQSRSLTAIVQPAIVRNTWLHSVMIVPSAWRRSYKLFCDPVVIFYIVSVDNPSVWKARMSELMDTERAI